MNRNTNNENILNTIQNNADSEYLFIYDFNTQQSHWTDKAVEYFGFSKNSINELQKKVHPDERENFISELNQIYALEKDDFSKSCHIKNSKGDYVLCRCKGKIYRDASGNSVIFAGTVVLCNDNVTYDSISGLQNVNGFSKHIAQCNEKDEAYTVLMIELHHFHDINTLNGYDFGNTLLYKLSNIFRDMIKDNGEVYRIERVTFAFVIKNSDITFAQNLYRQILWTAEHFEIDGYIFNLELFGVLWCVSQKHEASQIISILSALIDHSKSEEDYTFIIYDDERHKENSKSIELINTIKTSILKDCEGFYLCYQPFVSTITGRVIGAEALIRWRNSKYGNVSPYSFIPYIESHPCFYDLGLWILRQAISDAKKIKERCPGFFINVNVSYSQLQRKGFKETLIQILDEMDYPKESLQLELTERCRNLDMTFLQSQLQFFRKHNIKIALDDFGTGSATLELLCNLPLDCVKIDQTFILNILKKDSNQVIVDATMRCSDQLNVSVCLEGVENQEIKDFVEQYPASYHQGYYYSRPVEYNDFLSFLDYHWYTNNIKIIRNIGKLSLNANSIISMMPGGFFIYVDDEEQRITCANEELLRMFECADTEEFYELTHNSFKGIVHPDDYADAENSIRAQIACSDANMDYVKYRIITKSGKIKWVHDYGHLVTNIYDKNVFYVFLGDVISE